jgi:uncharacterized protein (DUF1697 family)
MTRHVALLRGINVGRAKRIAMADLRALFESLGFVDVQSLLNSGNVVFGVAEENQKNVAQTIEAAIAERLAVSVRVTVIEGKELDAIVAGNPLLDVAVDPTRLLVGILNSTKDRERLKPLIEKDWAPESLAIGKQAAYLWCPNGILESNLAKAVGKALGDSVTSRNWATILKLHAMAGSG